MPVVPYFNNFNNFIGGAPVHIPLRWFKLKKRKIENWWHVKTPPEKWDFIIEIGKKVSNVIGVHTFDHMKVNWFTATGGVFVMLYFVLNIYTIQYYWFRGAFVRGFECTYTVGLVIGVGGFSMKFFFLNSKNTVVSIHFL